MGYYIDLEKISIDDYKIKLETAYLPPSRMILKELRDERFGYFKRIGVNNVNELIQFLRKKDKFLMLQKVEFLSRDYLTILLRELNSMHPKPNMIREFPDINKEVISKLEKIGIKNTEKLFYKVVSAKNRKELAENTGIPEAGILELTKLTDLSRIKWVGANFARMLYDIGIDNAEKASKADPVELHQKINRINKERNIYKGQIGLNDIRIFVNAAKEVPLEIEY